MSKTERISVDRLHERLELDPKGVLRWRYCASMPKQWNSVWAGKEALTAVDGKGYRHGSLDYTYLRLHRVLWAMTYGAWPEGEIDHIDGDRQNNQIENLRIVTRTENRRNQKLSKNSSSGRMGVSWYKPYAKWRASISMGGGRSKHLGYFDDIEDATRAWSDARKQLGYHKNHGQR